ncbi:alkane 1-monooxygenase [Sinimarinibacterium sp. CAU 1509]|nr:alkane 1-monooxygenase [Sinimarinibacterium sp. CAU 1509]
MMKYIRSLAMPAMVVGITYTLMLGGWWMWFGILAVVIGFVVLDAILPEDLSEPDFGATWLLNLTLYTVLPLLVVMDGVFIWMAGSGDPMGLGAWVQQNMGIDMFAGRAATDSWIMWIGGVLSVGLFNAVAGTNVGHELTHRTSKPLDMFLGRWMLVFSSDVSFAIEHVYGHHVNVGTMTDPATAKRGESLYPFIVRSTIGSYAHAWKMEKARLAKTGKSVWNPIHSRLMRGNLMCVVPFVGAYYIAGWAGVGLFAVVSAWAKAVLEIANYFEHYGLVRDPSTPVQPRHSWNSNKMLSSMTLFSLTRHSHHHAEAEAEFWKLQAMPDAPMLPHGYLTMILVALVPPLFKRAMVPLLNDWDSRHATPKERELAREQSIRSGMRGLRVAMQS